MIITDEEFLRKPCEDVLPEEVDKLILSLEEELNQANRLGKGGIGLAAPQIGILKKIAIIRLGNGLNINIVNAKLEKGYDLCFFKDEGCLSFQGKTNDTMRFQEVHITNNLVAPHSFVATGLLAVVLQHELDHLNSTLFMDHAIVNVKPTIKVKVRPNDPCSCGSGKKAKRCCKK